MGKGSLVPSVINTTSVSRLVLQPRSVLLFEKEIEE
jgi:hypothetical protein